MTDFSVAITGMHCGACVKRVRTALERVPGVVDPVVEVGRARGQLDGATAAEVVEAITRAGYPAQVE
ncbi:MAG: heavy metal-associated domain-containing protein [Kofleriaceae bacterium]